MYCLEVIIKRIIRHVSRSVSTSMRPSAVREQHRAFLLDNHVPLALVRTHRLEPCSRYAQHFCGVTAAHPCLRRGHTAEASLKEQRHSLVRFRRRNLHSNLLPLRFLHHPALRFHPHLPQVCLRYTAVGRHPVAPVGLLCVVWWGRGWQVVSQTGLDKYDRTGQILPY